MSIGKNKIKHRGEAEQHFLMTFLCWGQLYQDFASPSWPLMVKSWLHTPLCMSWVYTISRDRIGRRFTNALQRPFQIQHFYDSHRSKIDWRPLCIIIACKWRTSVALFDIIHTIFLLKIMPVISMDFYVNAFAAYVITHPFLVYDCVGTFLQPTATL